MDPNETLRELRNLVRDGHFEEAHAHMAYLHHWLNRGGFQPELTNGFLISLLDCWVETCQRVQNKRV